MPQRKVSKAPRPAKEEIGEVLDKLYGHDEVIVRTVLQVLAGVIHEAHIQSKKRCWTLTRPDDCILRLNVHKNDATCNEAFVIHTNGDVKFVVAHMDPSGDVRQAIRQLGSEIIVRKWRYSTDRGGLKESDILDTVIAPVRCLGCLSTLSNLIDQPRREMLARFATGKATNRNWSFHHRDAVAHIRKVAGDVPDPEDGKQDDPDTGRQLSLILSDVESALLAAEHDIRAYSVEESRPEGEMSVVLINKYERDPVNRAKAIEIHGTRCQGCDFSFIEVYGERGEGYIEVHHMRLISSYKGPVQINPAEDLAVVCANCHRMIHRKADNPLSIEELRSIVKANRRR